MCGGAVSNPPRITPPPPPPPASPPTPPATDKPVNASVNVDAAVQSSVQNLCQNNKAGALVAMQSVTMVFATDSLCAAGGFNNYQNQFGANAGQMDALARGGCIPAPTMDQSAAPAGRGLQANPEGFPQGSIRTAGGYTIVPEGKDAAWSIFAPNQKMGEKPQTRVWGDPHVDEKDGTRWDFTKSSNFRLPDGTMIDVKTTSETGQSVTAGLNIVNGADRASISGINENKPSLAPMTRDGYEYRARLNAENPNRDTFVLGGNNSEVSWFRERAGKMDGLITGTKANFDGKGSYDQVVDANKSYVVDPSMRPPVGSAAWGNMLRNELTDAVSRTGMSPDSAKLFGSFMGVNHAQAEYQDTLRQALPLMLFGGLFNSFNNFGGFNDSLTNLGNVLQYQLALRQSLMANFAGNRMFF